MGNFPTLLEEDFQAFDKALKELLGRAGADFAVLIEKAGYRIHEAGNTGGCDTTSLASLAAGAFMATGMFTTLLEEPRFHAMYQQGEGTSTLILEVEESCLLLVAFRACLSVGAIKFYAQATLKQLAAQLAAARQRAPEAQVDLATLNPDEIGDVFQKDPERGVRR
jgi:predicted regulator of Ras-like GTPase activity (Roadblock/LC7/MglB family)